MPGNVNKPSPLEGFFEGFFVAMGLQLRSQVAARFYLNHAQLQTEGS